tara:strand:- start:357 stop:707 length:351 start_codon:yes stop_codon:yes gene_type:complete
MAVHTITVKKLISRVRQVFPDAPETYIVNLVNDALVEIGTHKVKVAHAKITTVADRMYYNLADGATDSSSNRLEANQVFRVYLMDSDGDYIQIPRLVDKNLLLADITSESNLNVPD